MWGSAPKERNLPASLAREQSPQMAQRALNEHVALRGTPDHGRERAAMLRAFAAGRHAALVEAAGVSRDLLARVPPPPYTTRMKEALLKNPYAGAPPDIETGWTNERFEALKRVGLKCIQYKHVTPDGRATNERFVGLMARTNATPNQAKTCGFVGPGSTTTFSYLEGHIVAAMPEESRLLILEMDQLPETGRRNINMAAGRIPGVLAMAEHITPLVLARAYKAWYLESVRICKKAPEGLPTPTSPDDDVPQFTVEFVAEMCERVHEAAEVFAWKKAQVKDEKMTIEELRRFVNVNGDVLEMPKKWLMRTKDDDAYERLSIASRRTAEGRKIEKGRAYHLVIEYLEAADEGGSGGCGFRAKGKKEGKGDNAAPAMPLTYAMLVAYTLGLTIVGVKGFKGNAQILAKEAGMGPLPKWFVDANKTLACGNVKGTSQVRSDSD